MPHSCAALSVSCEIKDSIRVLLPSGNQYETYCNLYFEINDFDSSGQILNRHEEQWLS